MNVSRNDRRGGEDFRVFDSMGDGGVLKPTEFKKSDSISRVFHRSKDSADLGVLKPIKDLSVFDFTADDFGADGDVWQPSKSRYNVGSDSYEIAMLRPRKSWECGGVSTRPKRKIGKENGARPKRKIGKENGVLQKKNKRTQMKSEEAVLSNPVITTMMDAVDFALDGLKKGQPVGVRRGSMLSLLSICKTPQQLQLLRYHGMVKTIIDAILELSLDDLPSNLAATALFYILTIDLQDGHLLDSPNCIRFLITMLKPCTSLVYEKEHAIDSKLLGMSKNTSFSKDPVRGTDSSSAAITLTVEEILVNYEEIETKDNRMRESVINPKWISLLTIKKACMSTILIRDTHGNRRNAGEIFTEKFRELGGLDAVFEVARRCHATIEEWLQKSPDFSVDLKDSTGLESLEVVLKCLRIMSGAAVFPIEDNKTHLLKMRGDFDGERAPRSCTKLIFSFIKILSGVSLRRRAKMTSAEVCRTIIKVCQNVNHSVLPLTHQESCNTENHHSHKASCSSVGDEEKSSRLIMHCLITAVRSLINLTHDCPEGCQQITACGGLEILSSLIADHFPLCLSILPKPSLATTGFTVEDQNFLVSILSVLINLIAVDGHYRRRFAAATVSVPIMAGSSSEGEMGAIPLICSVFKAYEGAGFISKEFVQSYSALFLAFLSTESRSIRAAIADCFPKKNLKILVPPLKILMAVQRCVGLFPPESNQRVLELIESCRIP